MPAERLKQSMMLRRRRLRSVVNPSTRLGASDSRNPPGTEGVILFIRQMKESAMPEIQQNNGVVTQITTVKLPPDKQDEVLKLMTERARFMATQPGFVSVSLHRSQDGSHVVNYIQWTTADKLAAAHHSPEFRKKWPEFGKIAEEIEPCLYEVVHVEAA
jgi:heme-degrading monooxygenase HmoA